MRDKTNEMEVKRRDEDEVYNRERDVTVFMSL